MSLELSWSAEEMRDMPSQEYERIADSLRENGSTPATPLYVPQPTRDLILSLHSAVVRSEDDDENAQVALAKLQKRVLMACARFEAATVIV